MMTRHWEDEAEHILGSDITTMRQELAQEQRKVARVREVLAAAEARIRRCTPPRTAELIIEVGIIELISLKDIRQALESEL